ncbi:MAG TPA: class I tRNA ligase family protein, partial [Acidobacteriota bacterium]|nr:class I tRNA ligase family protein [Acidobacteriota bacterium]
MALVVYNSLTKRLEPFEPLNPPEVRMYTCGPTVYHYVHIGNFRTFVFQDILRRYLKYLGYRLLHVMNITDVEDKIIAAARREGVSIREYTQRYEQAFLEDMATLRIERPEIMPRATEHIQDMIALIQRLEERGLTYRSGGSVYYRIANFPNYGKLS